MPNDRLRACRQKMLMVAILGLPLVLINRGGRGRGDGGDDRQSPAGDCPERDEIDTRCGNVACVIAATARVGGGLRGGRS